MQSDRERLLINFKQDLKLQSKTLRILFDSAFESLQSDNCHDPSVELLEALEQESVSRHAKAIYAGSLFLVLDIWVRSLAEKWRVKARVWQSKGEKVGNAPLAGLIWATGNNFRHHREWRNTQSHQAKQSIEVLEAAGIRGSWTENCAIEVLQAIGVNSYDEMHSKVERIADEIALSK